MLSCREKISMEGFFSFQVTKAGYTSETAVCLAPNPPPSRAFRTRIMEAGMCRALDTMRRTWNTIWVELTMFSRPWGSRVQKVRNVSIIACWQALVW